MRDFQASRPPPRRARREFPGARFPNCHYPDLESGIHFIRNSFTDFLFTFFNLIKIMQLGLILIFGYQCNNDIGWGIHKIVMLVGH